MNDELKLSLLDSGLCKAVSKARYKSFKDYDRSDLTQLEIDYGKRVIDECKKINRGIYDRNKRVFDKTKNIVVNGDCVFLTLTFKDSVIDSTNEETRRKYVRRFLKAQCDVYVANIDFGKKNEREHYHALVYAPSVDYSAWHKYGAIKGERVNTSKDDAKRVSKYVTKLSLHAIKKTAGKGRRIIYSRNAYLLLKS